MSKTKQSLISKTGQPICQINHDDCLVTVDYLANECNGLNSCDIQLDSQFLHSCKNHSDYLSLAYECVPGAKRVDICSNEETFIIDPFQSSESNQNTDLLSSRYGSFYLSSPNYPNEYTSNLNNCSCKFEYVNFDSDSHGSKQDEINLVFKSYEFDLEDGDSSVLVENAGNQNVNSECLKDYLRIESYQRLEEEVPAKSLSLCGQYKDFKEFYARGNSFKINFTNCFEVIYLYNKLFYIIDAVIYYSGRVHNYLLIEQLLYVVIGFYPYPGNFIREQFIIVFVVSD